MSEKIKQDISIGKNLHRLRKQAGLSQEQVAVKRVSVLIALKQIYGVSYEEFFQGLPDSR